MLAGGLAGMREEGGRERWRLGEKWEGRRKRRGIEWERGRERSNGGRKGGRKREREKERERETKCVWRIMLRVVGLRQRRRER